MDTLTSTQIRGILDEEYPEAKRLPKALVNALVEGRNISEVRPAGTHIDFNQDWPTIIETARNFIETITAILGLIAAWKKLESEPEESQEQKVLDRFKASRSGERCITALGENKVRKVIKKALTKK